MQEELNFLSLIIRTILALVVVLLLIYVTAKFGKRYGNVSMRKNLKILDRLPVSNKASVCVVKVGDEVLLLGVTENNINLLDKLPKEFAEDYSENEISNINEPLGKLINSGLDRFRKDNK